MNNGELLFTGATLTPVIAMLTMTLLARSRQVSDTRLWRTFLILSGISIAGTGLALLAEPSALQLPAMLQATPLGLVLAVLVQFLATIIASFSARYLQGEVGQARYITSLAGVLAAVQLLLLANHWLVLIGAWTLVGTFLQQLLCFYPDRPFARLAAHKKRIADRAADILLLAAAALAWNEVGSGSLSALGDHLAREGASLPLQFSAVGVVLAVILRTALMPVHGWLTQVMEAPTPVSALLHAGVVNLGGFVLILFAPLLKQAMLAQLLLVLFGLGTAVLAGMVMLTRISIKVRLAWSTVAQMGFMLFECGVGLYSLAALHLVGHSLYKAHAFLSASSVVRHTRLHALHSPSRPHPLSLLIAPVLTIFTVHALQLASGATAWPWWWSTCLGLAWAPLLWLPDNRVSPASTSRHLLAGLLMTTGLTAIALLGHTLPLGIQDAPSHALGGFALFCLSGLYLCLCLLQSRPGMLRVWRRWSYAGFYVDEIYTRIALEVWPVRWIPKGSRNTNPILAPHLSDSTQ